jgi:ABC-type antimicrobial peptide transport system permease subunit
MSSLGEDPYPFVWMPHAQAGYSGYFWPRTMRVAVRTAVLPEGLVPAVRQAVSAFDPDLPVYRVRTMEDAVSESLAEPRLATSLLGIFALLALILAGVGVYGVIAYSVGGRTREIGVRVALGADRGRVVRLVLADGLRPVAAGIAVGLVGAWLATGLVRSMLFGVRPNDGLTFVGVPLALLAVAGMATWLPALRATAIAPTEALREE